MKLKDTVNWMLSSDYKERLKAEYHQERIREINLRMLVQSYEEKPISIQFKHKHERLRDLLACLRYKLIILEELADIEDIKLW